MFEFLKQSIELKKMVNYTVTKDEIITAERRMGFQFPQSLHQFYNEIGYGFIKGDLNFVNRIMSPQDIADYVCYEENYDYVDRSIYDDNDLVFLHIADEDFLTIDYKDRKEGGIKYFDEKIANSFEEFIRMMVENPNYYI